MFYRNNVLLALFLICSGCVVSQTLPTSHEASTLPESKVALIKSNEEHGFMLHERFFVLTYFDGVESEYGFGPRGRTRQKEKILPGLHRLGIWVNWGDFCLSLYGGPSCFNFCYSGVVLNAEAGGKYGFDIEKTEDRINLLVLDNAGTVVAKSFCEKLPTFSHVHSSKTPAIKSIQERIEREAKELEFHKKAE